MRQQHKDSSVESVGSRAKRRHVRAFASGATLLLATAGDLRAELLPPVPMDVTILKSDAIVTFTVTTVRRAYDDAESVDVEVDTHERLQYRWDTALERIRFKGSVVPEGQRNRAVVRHQPALVEGNMYLAFLRGGPWHHTPVVSNTLYEIRDGKIVCGSGYVYGMNSFGFVCGTPDSHAGDPLAAPRVVAILERAIRSAKKRRPQLDSHFGRRAVPLYLERSREPHQ